MGQWVVPGRGHSLYEGRGVFEEQQVFWEPAAWRVGEGNGEKVTGKKSSTLANGPDLPLQLGNAPSWADPALAVL